MLLLTMSFTSISLIHSASRNHIQLAVLSDSFVTLLQH